MTDHAPFIAAVIARPDDDLPRLIYADWLDENGECERAEFIRVQCELCRCDPETAMRPPHVSEVNWRRTAGWRSHRRWTYLRRRERELLTGGPLPNNTMKWCDESGCRFLRNADYHTNWWFQRGFLSEIRCSWSDWQRRADTIRAATPIRKVRLTTEIAPIPYGVQFSPGRSSAIWIPRYPGIEFELPPAEPISYATGVGVPVDGMPGYAHGCIYHSTTEAGGPYLNEGTVERCRFVEARPPLTMQHDADDFTPVGMNAGRWWINNHEIPAGEWESLHEQVLANMEVAHDPDTGT
jgi:uncharacterized protein (TIGR02996 family)